MTVKKVVISCPGDVRPFLCEIERAINTFNSLIGCNHDIVLIHAYYGKDDYPISGSSPQETINREFVDDADYLICVFWARFGTATDEYESGTEEEYEKHTKKGKPASLFYLDDPISPSIVEASQLLSLQKFKENHEKLISKSFSKTIRSSELFWYVFYTLSNFFVYGKVNINNFSTQDTTKNNFEDSKNIHVIGTETQNNFEIEKTAF